MKFAHDSIHICHDLPALSQAVAQRWAMLSSRAVNEHGGFHVALSGGTTPRHLYEQLASPALGETLPWAATHIYFGDERCVPPDHPESNFHMATHALLQHVPIPQRQIHRIEAENSAPELCAIQYQRCLDENLPSTPQGKKYFDLILLGLGPDGHIASLFPDTDILREHDKLVAAVYVEKFQSWRISLTFSAIALARHVIILVAGNNKEDIISQVLGNKLHIKKFPVEMLRTSVAPEWYLDSVTATLLPVRR